MSNEIWKHIGGYKGLYQISNLGTIYDCEVNEPIKTYKSSNGYLITSLKKYGKWYINVVHRLVAEAFIGERPKNHDINHIDGNKLNNKANNLEYCTRKENIHHAMKLGLYPKGLRNGAYTKPERLARGDRHGNTKLPDVDLPKVFELRKLGLKQREIAALLGISRSNVAMILTKKSRLPFDKT